MPSLPCLQRIRTFAHVFFCVVHASFPPDCPLSRPICPKKQRAGLRLSGSFFAPYATMMLACWKRLPAMPPGRDFFRSIGVDVPRRGGHGGFPFSPTLTGRGSQQTLLTKPPLGFPICQTLGPFCTQPNSVGLLVCLTSRCQNLTFSASVSSCLVAQRGLGEFQPGKRSSFLLGSFFPPRELETAGVGSSRRPSTSPQGNPHLERQFFAGDGVPAQTYCVAVTLHFAFAIFHVRLGGFRRPQTVKQLNVLNGLRTFWKAPGSVSKISLCHYCFGLVCSTTIAMQLVFPGPFVGNTNTTRDTSKKNTGSNPDDKKHPHKKNGFHAAEDGRFDRKGPGWDPFRRLQAFRGGCLAPSYDEAGEDLADAMARLHVPEVKFFFIPRQEVLACSEFQYGFAYFFAVSVL